MSKKRKLLEQKDKARIIKFVNRFRDHAGEIKKIEQELEALQEKKNKVLESLEKTRGDEKIFTGALCEKYGLGHFDILDLNYWILKD